MVDRYVVEELIGEGGVAMVYKVTHLHLRSTHAMKVLSIRDPRMKARLIDEGRTQASLKHPNVLAVTDALLHDSLPCLIIEYVNGPTLADLLDDYVPTLEEALELFRGVLRGVDAAHRHGLVHRDLKPENVLLATTRDGVVPKVADFGLVKVLTGEGTRSVTADGSFLGTPAYMAPEQIKNSKNVDHRADMFSLGCLLYELVCGEIAFDGDTDFDSVQKTMEGEYLAPEAVVTGLPGNVVKAIRELLVIEPEERLANCEALSEVLYGDISMLQGPDDEDAEDEDSVAHLGPKAQGWIHDRSTAPAIEREVVPRPPRVTELDEPVLAPTPASESPWPERIGIAAVAFMSGVLAMVVAYLILQGGL